MKDIVDQVLDGEFGLDQDEFTEYCENHRINYDVREGCPICQSDEGDE